jgi:hypothetical protein
MPGHSDIRMTFAIYTHATDSMQDAATEALYKRRSPTSRLLTKGPGSYTGALYFRGGVRKGKSPRRSLFCLIVSL